MEAFAGAVAKESKARVVAASCCGSDSFVWAVTSVPAFSFSALSASLLSQVFVMEAMATVNRSSVLFILLLFAGGKGSAKT